MEQENCIQGKDLETNLNQEVTIETIKNISINNRDTPPEKPTPDELPGKDNLEHSKRYVDV